MEVELAVLEHGIWESSEYVLLVGWVSLRVGDLWVGERWGVSA